VMPVGLGSPESIETKRLPLTRGMADLTLQDLRDQVCWESIQVARFDWLWPRLNGGNPDVHGVKIDVQGMEADVIAGMHEMLRSQRPAVVLELHRGVDRERILALLSEAGYSTNATPIEPRQRESVSQFIDNHSYAFVAAS
jgi:hypothetical protein